MKGISFKAILLLVSGLVISSNLFAQNEFDGTVKFDRTVYDFGDILVSDGAKECSFSFTNIGKEPVVINRVISSCGCTEPSWTKKPIRPGEKGEIKVTYKNDQGPYPFNKTITTYISGLDKPVPLRIKGVAYEKEKSLKELYPYAVGSLGFREEVQDMGQIEQGLSKSEEIKVANISSKPLKVEFLQTTDGMALSLSPNPLPANSKGVITCTINSSKTEKQLWGKSIFSSSVSINGVTQKGKMQVKTLIKENFSSLTEAQRKAGSLIQFSTSSVNFGTVKPGTKIPAIFQFKNLGKEDLVIYKIDCSEPGAKIDFPSTVAGGKSGTISINLETAGLPDQEMLYIFTIITNCPTRPIVNIFSTGTIKK